MATRNGTGRDPASSRETLDLAENDAARLPTGRFETIVRVERGTVLVTQEDDLEDHVLEVGDELVLHRRGLAVAWALTDARLRVGTNRAGARFARRSGHPRHGPGEAPSHAWT